MQTLPKILLIEDNLSLITALRDALKSEYELDTTTSGKTGLYRADITDYDVIILDLLLPDSNGLNICQQLRERGIKTPVLILSAEAKVLSKINLLDAGADDYLTKPFSLGELKARLRVALRQRLILPKTVGVLEVGTIKLDPARFEVAINDLPVRLRKKEFLLLECLMRQPGSVVSRTELIRFGWQGIEKPWANTVDVHIKYLRDKLGQHQCREIIKTVHGLGYKLVIDTSQKALIPS